MRSPLDMPAGGIKTYTAVILQFRLWLFERVPIKPRSMPFRCIILICRYVIRCAKRLPGQIFWARAGEGVAGHGALDGVALVAIDSWTGYSMIRKAPAKASRRFAILILKRVCAAARDG